MERTGRGLLILAFLLVFLWQGKCCTELYIEHRGGPCISMYVCEHVCMHGVLAGSPTHLVMVAGY